MTRPILIVAGPTCSGKSALALMLARRFGGVIINADAMQTYADLRIVTARPAPEEEALVPHRLYGVRPAEIPATAAWWRGAARAAIEATDGLPILCGGSFLYLDALLHGLAEIPAPAPAVRDQARALLAAIGPAALHQLLAAADPATAARLRPTDGQRLARAWEVLQGTGTGLAAWQDRTPDADAGLEASAIVLQPDRAGLRAAIAGRWDAMIGAGAVAEVAALHGRGLDPALPLMRAHGVPELCAHLDGTLSLAEAGRRAILATGRYTKRQATWMRHHRLAPDERTFHICARWGAGAQENASVMAGLNDFMSHVG